MMSHLNGLYLGINNHNELMMHSEGGQDAVKWSWDGNMIKNKNGLVMDISGSNKDNGIHLISFTTIS